MITARTLSCVLSLCFFTLFNFSATPTHGEVLGDSRVAFSGVQDPFSWQWGYRNYTTDGGGVDYAVTDFITFPGGEGMGPWDGVTQTWTGSAWDLNTASAQPWTFMEGERVHPNGANQPEEHWTVRRFNVGNFLFETTPLAVTYHTRKDNSNGTGVTGALHVNGVRVDSQTIAGNDQTGFERTYYVNADFGTILDLVQSPVGLNGDRSDGSDMSRNWMVVKTDIPDIPVQPDGTLFIPANAPDSDDDGLVDVWERFHAGDDLTILSADQDSDGDGLTDGEEFDLGTNPVKEDTDGDGLSDGEEGPLGTDPLLADTDGDGVNDGDEVNVYGSDPLLVDTDSDGFDDGSEVSTGHDPTDPNINPDTTIIANSTEDFSGVQGQDDWFWGYRNRTADGGGVAAYDPADDFIPFAGGEGQGAWDGTTQQWTGDGWDLNTAAAAPWTVLGGGLGPNFTHPNGDNNGPIHWTIKRWVADQITEETPLTIRWHIRKQNTGCCNGVTGGIYINGQLADSAVIAGNDGVGVFRTLYANVEPGDVIDLIQSPQGTDGTNNDGADGSFSYMRIDPTLPPPPLFQPDGSLFIPAGASDGDGDGLPDAWELSFVDDLGLLSGDGDFDNDGLTDLGEFQAETDPTVEDSDADGLLDGVETNDGIFVDANATGSNPRIPDTDGDGLTDGDEVNPNPFVTNPNRPDTDDDGFDDAQELADGTDPTDPASNLGVFIIADSIRDWSNGIQGQDNWYYGYRNWTQDGGGNDFNAESGFIPFKGGAGQGPWEEGVQEWAGGFWDLQTAPMGPWTSISQLDIHPNGENSPPGDEHWAIRRWVADELTEPTPVAIMWNVEKANGSQTGVTGSLHVNGQQVDARTIAGNTQDAPVRTYYVNLEPGDIVDLAVTPEGITGDRLDFSDGSRSWFLVDIRLPGEPRQPDGSLFIPVNAPDTDEDGLPDFWELIYAPDLTVLASATDDNDDDGVDNGTELARDGNPLDPDGDDDGLLDGVETNTGIFAGSQDTGTNPGKADTDGDGRSDGEEVNGFPRTDPNNPDSDGDGFNDGDEVATGTNPNNPDSNPNTAQIANSIAEFSQNQGENGWFDGYRNVTQDGQGLEAYDPDDANFFPNGAFISYDEMADWTGSAWDINTAGGAPWTFQANESGHPNGTNSGGVEHWAIRRWVAEELTGTTPVAIQWRLRKQNTNGGNGTSGQLHINGILVDKGTVGGTDGTGITRTFYANLEPDDIVDLALTPEGLDGGRADGADGSFFSFTVSTAIPPDPIQPDGTPFVLANTPPTVVITSPVDGALLTAGSSVEITADASDEGAVTQVEFTVEGVGTVGVDDTEPFSTIIPNVPAGTFVLQALATDNLGTVGASPRVTVEVVPNQAPSFVPGDTVVVDEDAGPVTVAGWASDISAGPAHEADQALSFEISGDTRLFSEGPEISSNGDLAFTAAPNACGVAELTVVLRDDGGTAEGGNDTSEPATLRIEINCINDAPTCSDQSVSTNEDVPTVIALAVEDPDMGDTLTVTILSGPTLGMAEVSGTSVTYTPAPNENGSDSFTYMVSDAAGATTEACTVSITVVAVNDSPVPVIEVSPTFDLGDTVGGTIVISPNNVGACVTLDGSQTSDVDTDFGQLTFGWYVDGVLVSAEMVAENLCLPVGAREVTLVVNDNDSDNPAVDEPSEAELTRLVDVLLGDEAIEELILAVNDSLLVSRKNKQPFIASLKTSAAAIQRGSFGAACNMLEALTHKLRAQLKHDPELRDEWIRIAREIIRGVCGQTADCDGCIE